MHQIIKSCKLLYRQQNSSYLFILLTALVGRATTARAGRVFCERVGKFGGKKCVMQYTRFLHPNAGVKLASP